MNPRKNKFRRSIFSPFPNRFRHFLLLPFLTKKNKNRPLLVVSPPAPPTAPFSRCSSPPLRHSHWASLSQPVGAAAEIRVRFLSRPVFFFLLPASLSPPFPFSFSFILLFFQIFFSQFLFSPSPIFFFLPFFLIFFFPGEP